MRFSELLEQLDPVAHHVLALAHRWQAERNAVPGGAVDLAEAVATMFRLLDLRVAALVAAGRS